MCEYVNKVDGAKTLAKQVYRDEEWAQTLGHVPLSLLRSLLEAIWGEGDLQHSHGREAPSFWCVVVG